jgi:Eukaryotic protein of unknown function (DUF829)
VRLLVSAVSAPSMMLYDARVTGLSVCALPLRSAEAHCVDQATSSCCCRGLAVTVQRWQHSSHCAHLRRHPAEYITAVRTFLKKVAQSRGKL